MSCKKEIKIDVDSQNLNCFLFKTLSMSSTNCLGRCFSYQYEITRDTLILKKTKKEVVDIHKYILKEEELKTINQLVIQIIKTPISPEYFKSKVDIQVIGFILETNSKMIETVYQVDLEPKMIEKLNTYIFKLSESRKGSIYKTNEFNSRANELLNDKGLNYEVPKIDNIPPPKILDSIELISDGL